MSEGFFEEPFEQSKVKTAIVAEYFLARAQVISGFLKNKKDKRIAYIDLFAGPGRYKNGAKSTPVFILEQAIANEALRENPVTRFNDREPENTSSLIRAIRELDGIDTLKHPPQVATETVGEEIVKRFEEMSLIPTLMFVDPWGYKGLSLRLVNSVLKDWACECILFFNHNRINMGLSNEKVRTHMEALFGAERAAKLTKELEPLAPDERELTIVERLVEALEDMGGRYVLPFGFRNENGTRTEHHLIFVSKHPLGYSIMKHVMHKHSTEKPQGVAKFEYSPATGKQPLLFEYTRPLDDLEGMLLEEFAGQTIKCRDIIERHGYRKPYMDKNHKDVLMAMEIAGKVTAVPNYKRRRKNTCADHVTFTFPPKRK